MMEALREKIQMLLEKHLSKRHKINTYRWNHQCYETVVTSDNKYRYIKKTLTIIHTIFVTRRVCCTYKIK